MFEVLPLHSHRELVVWQKAMDLVVRVYHLTEQFPRSEQYGLVSQMRRAAVSIPSNIAEGRSRGTRADFVQFLRIAHGSAAELTTQLELAQRISFVSMTDRALIEVLLIEITNMLNAMIRRLNPRIQKL